MSRLKNHCIISIMQQEVYRKGVEVLERNWTGSFTIPSSPHYPDLFLWDSCAAAINNSRRGEPEMAAIELQTLLQGIDPNTGFIPNRRLVKRKNWRDLEALLTFTNRSQSNYTQPLLVAHSAWETYEGFVRKNEVEKGREFLKGIYETAEESRVSGLRGAYGYFARFRENGNGSRLVGIIHPNETGRDSDPSLKRGAVRIPNKGVIVKFTPAGKEIIPLANTVLDLISHFRINLHARKHNWEVEKIRSKYWINDVMFNVLYVNNLAYMAKISKELGKNEESIGYESLALEVEKEILEKMWNEDDGFFYNLDKDGKQIPIASISGLFPLTMEHISKEQLTALLNKLESPEWFNTRYPIPSIPVNNPRHDPDYKEKRLWLGGVFILPNFLLSEEGLAKQIKRFQGDRKILPLLKSCLKRLVSSTEGLVEKSGIYEFYSSKTGKGHRVKNFTWSVSAFHLDISNSLLKQEESG